MNESEMGDKSHSVRVRETRWEKIEKHAWKLSQQANRFIKPTDIVDAVLFLHASKITLEDIENAKKTR
ncbi:hypothetical protein [Hahella sp. HN01]|uniref:hypothetical protein n=1 Tax=Hahella sp. HN01 TaxID=2847262 RepID=UPI001C1F048D|nr:hypothetical protein [Hahella sp. HN01]MBU6955546.1 hypothetical protein [Hahella sp. HN01]